jgi:predicted small metal-binding protein
VVTISVTAQLEFDGHILVASDTLYLDDSLLSWNTDHFEYQTSKLTVGLWRYFVNSTLANEVTHGITSLNPTILWTDVVWDRILILTTSTTDDRVDYASSAEIIVTAVLEYDNHPLGSDDTLYMDNSMMSWSIDHFEYLPSMSEVGLWWYFVNSTNALENTFGITLLNLNSKFQEVIWDRIEFYQSGVVDGRININSVGETWWRARYQYDGVQIDITKGFSAALNGSKILAWDAGAARWRYQESSPSIQSIGYHVILASELVYGLSQWVATTSNTTIIWDQILVVSYATEDSRIDISTACSCNVTLIFDFDDSFVIDGSIWINGIGATYSGSNGVWDFNETRNDAQLVTLNLVSAAANEHGITSVNQNSQTQGVIWDSLTITITVGDSRINVGTIASVVPSAIYDYDSTAYDGTLQLNDTVFQQAIPGRRGYTLESASGDSHGITAIRQNMIVSCIWDSLTVSITAVDYRINIGDTASISAIAVYDYDNTPYDGTLYLNDTEFQQGFVGARAYTVESVSGDTYGITVISSNDVDVVIWDRLRVLSYSVSDARCDLGSIQEVTALVIREYDSVLFTGAMGTVFLNGTAMAWDSVDLVWTQLETYSIVVRYAFGVSAITDTQFGISATNTPAEPSIIWDALSITLTVADNRINVGDTASINPEASYLYDGSTYDGTLILNDTVFVHGTAQQHWYNVSSAVGDDTYGITIIEINDAAYCIWDSLTISMTDPSDQRIDVSTNASGIVVAARYDFDNAPYDGSLVLNNTVFMYNSTQRQGYKVLLASGEDSFGITAISQNAETFCIWDSLSIAITDPPDQRVNIGDNATGIVVSATYDFDGTVYDGTLVLNDTQFLFPTVGKRGYEVLTANGDDGFGITAISTPDYTFCIWDRLRVEISVDGASLFNGMQANFTLTVRYDYDFSFCTTYEIVISRNMTQWNAFTDLNKTLFRDTASDAIYYYNASSVTSDTQFGITAFFTNTQKVTWSEAPNEVPENNTDALWMLENADDSDNLYAMYRFYVITSNVSDGNGYDAIQYVEISLYDDLRIQAEWTLRYTVASDTFSIQQGAGNVTIASWSAAFGAGNQLEVTWIIKIDWGHSDLTDIDIRQYVTDGIDSDEDYYEANWDVETRLDMSGLAISDGSGTVNRGPLDGSFTVSGTLLYLGSGDDNPLSNETDVWVLSSEYGSAIGPWSDTTLVSGQFILTAFADDAVGQDTIAVKAVEEGLGAGAQDLFPTTIEGAYTADRVFVQSYSPDDPRVNVDENVNLDLTLINASDSSPDTDGTVTINSISASHIGGGLWRVTVTRSSVQEVVYDIVAYAGGAHGLTQVDQNDQSQSVIWDSLTITITGPNDNRINIFQNASGIVVTATYDFDNSEYDGTLNINDTLFATDVAKKKGYTVLSADGDDAYGITLIGQNDEVYCIWDSLTITMTDPLDQRVNIGTNASGIVVTAVYDYDNSSFDGILTLNNTQFVYGDARREGYGILSISGGIHGITAVSNDDETFCIWDALRISITDPPDQRIDVNQNASGIIVSARYDYDNSVYEGTLILNDTGFVSVEATKKAYTVLSALGDDLYGITTILSNDQTWCIWDQILVLSLQASDARDNVGDPIWVDVILRYEYDTTPVEDGSVTINGRIFQHIGLGLWRHNRTEMSVTSITFDSVSCAGNSLGIQSVTYGTDSRLLSQLMIDGLMLVQ